MSTRKTKVYLLVENGQINGVAPNRKIAREARWNTETIIPVELTQKTMTQVQSTKETN